MYIEMREAAEQFLTAGASRGRIGCQGPMPVPRFSSLRPATLAILIGLAVAALLSVLQALSALGPLEHVAYDLRFRLLARPELASRQVVVIALDNASFESREMLDNFGRWPWHRKLYAELLWYLRQAPARAIGIDVTFAGRDSDEASDRLFAEQLEVARDTVLAFSLNRAAITWSQAPPEYAEFKAARWTVDNVACAQLPDYTGVEISEAELNRRAGALGCISLAPDSDGVIRRAPLLFRYDDRYYPAFAAALAGMAGAASGVPAAKPRAASAGFDCRGGLRLAGRRVPLAGKDASALVYWYGPYDRGFRHYPVWQVVNSALALFNRQKPEIPPAEFRDKIVLIGSTATGIGDLRPTPFSAVFPGVDVHATLISNLIEGHFLRQAGRFWSIAAIVLMTLAGSVAVWVFADWRVYSALSLALAAAYLAVNFWLFWRFRVSLVIMAPLLAVAACYAAGSVGRYITEGREKRRYRSTLVRYVSPQIVEAIMRDRRLAELHNEKRDLTVLFSDVRGFTTLSEKTPVDRLVATLNEFLNAMVQVIFRRHGTLDKFVGDCVMAFWGAPVRQENHAELAARAALEMQAELARLNAAWRQQGRPELKIGVGINTGEMIFGNIGSERRMDFTVIGDNVNLASRLESSTKELNAGIVISEATWRRIAPLAQARDLGTIHVKGKDVPVRVFELLGMAEADVNHKDTKSTKKTAL